MLRLLREAGGYTIASFLAFVLDIALLALQVDLLGVPYLIAATVSFLVGTAFIYWAAIRHIFEYRRLADARLEFTLFLVAGCIGLGVNLGVIYAAVEMLGAHYLVAKVGAAVCTFGVNFALRRWWLFSRWRRAELGTRSDEVLY